MPGGTTTEAVGRVLAQRYRILAPIGSGSGGTVYVGHDVRLKRRVAVKVLHPALADDEVFLRRFRAEAQIAAGLGHPNIMAVYDWGEDAHVPFMVLELLPGGSLRALLAQDRLLSVSQAAHVGHQVLAALRYAHARGVVHRDVKPGNLLFDEHGNVRVGDFGLARALAHASWTEPAGAATGTARYAPPEQAAGTSIDGRADLYSLAVVLVEAVTGRVPQLADSPLGTLAARSRLGIEASELGPLGPVVERAGRPHPQDRFSDAAEMDAALAAAAARLPPPAPIALPGLEVAHDDEPTRMAVPVQLYDQDRERRGAGRPHPASAPRRSAERAPGSHRLVPAAVALALVAAIAAAGVAFATTRGTRVAVPGLVGRSMADAIAVAQNAGFDLTVHRRTSDDPKDVVVRQSPARGAFTDQNGTVEVVVSRGPPKVAFDAVKGRPLTDVQAALTQAGFVVTVHRAFDDNVAKDTVVDSDPPGLTRAPRESEVVLVVSDGPNPVPIPNVAGKTYEEAAAALAPSHFQVTRRDDFSDTVDIGKVISTDPVAGSKLQPGGAITVTVSKGPELVAVPGVIGLTLDAAKAALTAKGLNPVVISGLPSDKVFGQDLPANTMVKKGTSVRIAA